MRLFDRFRSKKSDTRQSDDNHSFEDTPPSKPLETGFFEFSRPQGEGRCSDNACLCDPGGAGDIIPRGTGYLWISSQVVESRRTARSEAAVKRQLEQKFKSPLFDILGSGVVFAGEGITPTLMCRIGAEQRGINLEVAAADAKYWWETGLVQLRPTPYAKKRS
jgi:hypothetical protein